MLCFIKKYHERKQEHLPSYFYKENCECKKRKMYAHNIYFTNIKGPKYIWVPKVEKSNYDANDDTDICFSSYTTEEINMFYYSTPMKE